MYLILNHMYQSIIWSNLLAFRHNDHDICIHEAKQRECKVQQTNSRRCANICRLTSRTTLHAAIKCTNYALIQVSDAAAAVP